MQVGARKLPRRRTAALRVERTRIVGMPGVFDVDRAEAGESKSMAAVARGQDAVEHVDAAGNRLENIRWRAHAHQITRLREWQSRRGGRHHAQHHLFALADREPADRVPVEAKRYQRPRALLAQPLVVAALDNAE